MFNTEKHADDKIQKKKIPKCCQRWENYVSRIFHRRCTLGNTIILFIDAVNQA